MRSHRQFLSWSALLLITLAQIGANAAARDRGNGIALSASERLNLNRALEPLHAQYDPAERMIRRPFSSPGYHTTLTGGFVHPTRDSLQYAVALLDTGEEQWFRRGCEILERVIALQDQNPINKTYGIWSWFLEEPLERMSPPDWNWADFCGVSLLQVALDHRDRLPPELARKVETAIQHAVRSIRKRNVGPGYTNIAIMGTYVTLVAGEFYNWPEFIEYGLARLLRFHEHTMLHGAFTEYNSPTYTVVALEELGRLRKDVQNSNARRLIEEIYRLAWEEIAFHFHAPTRQWAGPHSRCYNTMLGEPALAMMQRATEGRVQFGVNRPALFAHRVALPCPPDLERFLTAKETRTLVKPFMKSQPPLVGTTHFEPAFCLGSINRQDMWNQRRNLLAYFGTAKEPSYLGLRFMHDGYDFAAARFWSRQERGRTLAAITLASEGGDRHPSLDPIKKGTIRARDLRMRFELGGAAARNALPKLPAHLTEPLSFRSGEVTIQIAVPFAQLNHQAGRWDIGTTNDTAFLDVVLHSGEEKVIALAELSSACVALVLQMSAHPEPIAVPQATPDNSWLRLKWDGLTLTVPLRPDTRQKLDEQVTD